MNAKRTKPKPATTKSSAKRKPKAEARPEASAPERAPVKQRRAAKTNSDKPLSALDAAARVLQETGAPMSAGQMIEAMAQKGYWSSPHGQTPAATLYSAILRELAKKQGDARFKKTERGKFAFNG